MPGGTVVKCRLCGLEVETRCGRYWFLLLQERGRGCERSGDPGFRFTLCGPCGSQLSRELELYEFGRGLYGLAYLDRGVVRD